jgi:hypothetical protein
MYKIFHYPKLYGDLYQSCQRPSDLLGVRTILPESVEKYQRPPHYRTNQDTGIIQNIRAISPTNTVIDSVCCVVAGEPSIPVGALRPTYEQSIAIACIWSGQHMTQ